jgi:uncharacterized protein YndB with AHSA1/START domain
MSDYGVVIEPGTVRFERLLPGPIERVWAYLTESDKRAKWLASGPMELRVGGGVELLFRNSDLSPTSEPIPEKCKQYENGVGFAARITRCEPPRFLSHTWGGENGEDSEVAYELSLRGNDVLLVLTHRRLGDRASMLSVSGGWHTHLGILIDHLNGKEPEPFWAAYERLEGEYDKRLASA